MIIPDYCSPVNSISSIFSSNSLYFPPFPLSFVLLCCFGLYTVKSFSDDFTGIGDQDKCGWLGLLNIVPKPDRLRTLQCCENDIFVFPGKCSLCVDDGRTAAQFVDDERADRIWFVADNIEVFGQIKTFNEVVHHERTDGQSEYRVESRLDIEDEKPGGCDQCIGEYERTSDIKAGIFLQDHGDDVCSSAGRADIEQQRGAKCRQRDGKTKFQHGLVGQRRRHGTEMLQRGQKDREQNTAIGCFCRKFLSQDDKTDHQKEHVRNKRKVTGREDSGFCNQNGKTGNPSESKVVSEFEKICADCHNTDASRQYQKMFEFIFHNDSSPRILSKYDVFYRNRNAGTGKSQYKNKIYEQE